MTELHPNLRIWDLSLARFDALPIQEQDVLWRRLADGVAHNRAIDEITDIYHGRVEWRPTPPPPQPRRRPRPPVLIGEHLRDIAPTDYALAIEGLEAPGNGRKVFCPFHEERTPSLALWDDPARGWNCYGCGRGGTIFEFAAASWGYSVPLRGQAFKDVRDRLLDLFGR